MFTRKLEPKPTQLQSFVAQDPARPEVAMPPTLTGARPMTMSPAGIGAAGSIIGQDLSIEGQGITIRCQGALTVNGSVHADLHGREISVGEQGAVIGSITADAVDVWGRVGGMIRGARVSLHASARVDGDIHAGTLAIEDGASFEGRSRKATDPTSIAPQLQAGAPRDAAVIALPPPLRPA